MSPRAIPFPARTEGGLSGAHGKPAHNPIPTPIPRHTPAPHRFVSPCPAAPASLAHSAPGRHYAQVAGTGHL